MILETCANGHVYDTDVYSQCPYCDTGLNNQATGQYAPANGGNYAAYDQQAGYYDQDDDCRTVMLLPCPSCGEMIEPDSKFCPKCGNRMATDDGFEQIYGNAGGYQQDGSQVQYGYDPMNANNGYQQQVQYGYDL